MILAVSRRAYVFRAELVRHPGVLRTIALAEEQTLELLHELLRAEYGWDDPHLYSFWLSGRFWDGPQTEYSAPDGLEESGARSARTPLGELGLEQGQRIAYLFDFGDQWEVEIDVLELREAGDEPYPRVLEAVGEAPPQYPPVDEDDE